MRQILIRTLVLALMVAPLGCSKYKTFRFSFGNRTLDAIAAKVDGELLGAVAPGTTEQFSHEVRILDSSPSGPRETRVAEVTFSAENIRTGRTTRGFRRTVYEDRVEHIDVDSSDFR